MWRTKGCWKVLPAGAKPKSTGGRRGRLGVMCRSRADGLVVGVRGRAPVRCYTSRSCPRHGGGAPAPCGRVRSTPCGDLPHQAHVPAQEALPSEDARLPYSHVHSRGSAGAQGAAAEGSQASDARAGSVNRRHRLRGRRAFAAVRLARLSGASPTLRAGAAPNGLGVARVGFAIPSRVGGAVVRNRLRRRLRATLRSELPRLAGVDLVIVAAPAAAGLTPERLRAELLASIRGIRGIGPGIGDNGGDRPQRSGTPAAR